MTNVKTRIADEWNHRGVQLFSQGRWEEAIQAYLQAIDYHAAYVDPYYNLGLAYTRLGLLKEAINAYQAVLEIIPSHQAARFQLSLLYMRDKDFTIAIQHLLEIAKEQPFYFETLVNLATCYLQLGNLFEAKGYYLQALELDSTDHQVVFNLGVISMQLGRMKEAIQYYLLIINQLSLRSALSKEALVTLYAAHNNLGVAYLGQKNKKAALLHFREASRMDLPNQALRHIIQLLENKETIESCPIDYVRSLFNSYADHYDAHLQISLAYQLPTLLYEMVKRYVPIGCQQWRILDLGCGTGLCGEQLISYASTLSGVDIAEEMLKIAAEKRIYDHLVQSDLVSFLQQSSYQYDLILIADVLPYFGAVDSLFSVIHRVLPKKGWIIVSAEKSEGAPYEMMTTGRFSHHADYLANQFSLHRLSIIEHKTVVLRQQDGISVIGYLYLLQLVD